MRSPATVRDTNPAETSYMRQRAAQTGVALHDLRERWTPLSSISPVLIGAVVHAEDPRFFDHRGVDVAALVRKLTATIRGRMTLVGASTLTQQLARNLYLLPTRSIGRKLRELDLALRLEATLSKPRILELYLNVIEWGVDVWGCEAASLAHLSKHPDALDLFDSTFLASLIPAPRAPLSGRNAVRSQYVQLRAVYQMLLAGLISAAECSCVTRRIRQMHARLAAGATLAAAMAGSSAVSVDTDEIASLEALCRALDVRPLTIATVADVLAAKCGCDQERRAWRALRARVGQDAIVGAVVTGHYESLRPILER